ncbi:MAG: HPP family protein [Gammaproteobacteria bacterium]|jgi:CBS domain-containing membrane protein|nr:HPP family protein [Gammaproteobacteria bacterium]
MNFKHFIGFESNKTGHLEKWVSALGGLFGILGIILVSQYFLGEQEAAWVVASMGATAVLVFAVPHGPLSQPWAVVGGHLISAVIGVACARWIPISVVAAAVAVAAAIGSMHYLRCIHPPGGATALTAVIGGENIQALGFHYVLTPILINAAVIVLIAMAFNYAFHWRRYPAALAARPADKPEVAETTPNNLSEDDLETALQEMKSTVDISREDLEEIYHLARENKLTELLKGFRN